MITRTNLAIDPELPPASGCFVFARLVAAMTAAPQACRVDMIRSIEFPNPSVNGLPCHVECVDDLVVGSLRRGGDQHRSVGARCMAAGASKGRHARRYPRRARPTSMARGYLCAWLRIPLSLPDARRAAHLLARYLDLSNHHRSLRRDDR